MVGGRINGYFYYEMYWRFAGAKKIDRDKEEVLWVVPLYIFMEHTYCTLELRGCLYGGELARVPGLAAFPRSNHGPKL